MNKNRQIKIKNEYLKMIYDLGFDYDGCNTVESLKELVDTLCEYAKMALDNDDKSVIFGGRIGEINLGKAKNILLEDLEENKYE